MGDRLRAGIPSRYVTSQLGNSALHPFGVAKSSTSFGWGKGGNVTSAGWQVTLCDPMWHVSSRSGVATLRTAIHLLLTYLLRQCDRSTLLLLLLLQIELNKDDFVPPQGWKWHSDWYISPELRYL